MDKMNRDRFKSSKIPSMPKLDKLDKIYIKEAIHYVEKHFPNNYGNIDSFCYPICHSTVKKWISHFIYDINVLYIWI